MSRDFAIALSLSNLCFIRAWARLPLGANGYFVDYPNPAPGAMLDVLLLALLIFAVVTTGRRWNNHRLLNAARLVFLITLVIPVNALRINYPRLILNVHRPLLARLAIATFLIAAAALVLYLLVRRYRQVVRLAALLVLLFSPFVVVTFYQAISSIVEANRPAVKSAARAIPDEAAVKARRSSARVVWIVFDELDQRLAFVARPPTVSLPELDRLRSQALFAANAYAPSRYTEISIPALLAGRLIAGARLSGPNELLVSFPGAADAVPWSKQSNVFSRAQAAGFRSGLAGWLHPYCSTIGQSITDCRNLRRELERNRTLVGRMWEELFDLLSAVPLGYRVVGQRQEFKQLAEDHSLILSDARQLVADGSLDLVFVHFPIPHPPGIFDRHSNQLALDGKRSYLDNLVLGDHALGELRQAMEHSGLWDRTTIIVTADHSWRSDSWSHNPLWKSEEAAVAPVQPDHRVPFLVKLAGAQEPGTYEPEFNNVLTADLVLALLRSEVNSRQTVAAWVDRHRSFGDSPYSFDTTAF